MTVSEWVKCSERMPEPGRTVIACNAITSIAIVRFVIREKEGTEGWEGVTMKPPVYSKNWFTHWMPLPEVPE